jgi:hypothetical protein
MKNAGNNVPYYTAYRNYNPGYESETIIKLVTVNNHGFFQTLTMTRIVSIKQIYPNESTSD